MHRTSFCGESLNGSAKGYRHGKVFQRKSEGCRQGVPFNLVDVMQFRKPRFQNFCAGPGWASWLWKDMRLRCVSMTLPTSSLVASGGMAKMDMLMLSLTISTAGYPMMNYDDVRFRLLSLQSFCERCLC